MLAGNTSPSFSSPIKVAHLIQAFCVIWDKIFKVELCRSPAREVCFPTSDCHWLLPPHQDSSSSKCRTCRGFWVCPHHLVQLWLVSLEPQLSVCRCHWEASRQFSLLPYPDQCGSATKNFSNTWSYTGKKGHLSLLLTPFEEIIQAATAELLLHDMCLPSAV